MLILKLIDDLFEHYRTMLTGDDEDIDILALAVLEQLNREDILEHLQELNEIELRRFFGLYIMDALKRKFAEVNPNSPQDSYFSDFKNVH